MATETYDLISKNAIIYILTGENDDKETIAF